MTIPVLLLVGCFGDSGSESLSEARKEADSLSEQVKSLEEQRSALRKEKAEKKSKMPKASPRKGTSSESASQEKSENLTEAEGYVAVLEESLGTVDSQIGQWRGPVRKSFQGLPFKRFQLANEEVIPLVKILEVSDNGVKAEVEGVSKDFSWQELSQMTRLALLHEPTVAAEAVN